jgi:hypothetical protein
MADGVAEVEHLPAAAVALVARDDAELGARAREDEVGVDLGMAGADALPQRAAGDQRRLDDLRPSPRRSPRRAAWPARTGPPRRPPAGGRPPT